MALAPWLQPPNFLQAMSAGSQAGLESSRIAQAGQEAAAHLALAGAQLAAENARAQDANSLRRQDLLDTLLERSQQHSAVDAFNKAKLAEQNRHNMAIEGRPVAGQGTKYWDVGGKLVSIGPDGKAVINFDPTAGQPNKVDSAIAKEQRSLTAKQLMALSNNIDRLQFAISKEPDATIRDNLTQQLNESKKRYGALDSILNPPKDVTFNPVMGAARMLDSSLPSTPSVAPVEYEWNGSEAVPKNP